MSAKMTIVPALRRRLPVVLRRKPLEATDDTSISSSTRAMGPTTVWKDDGTRFFDRGEQCWQILAVEDKQQGHKYNEQRSKNEILPEEEYSLLEKIGQLRSHTALFSEADVVRVSNRLLFDPIEVAIKALCIGLNLRVRSEKSEQGGRVDFVWEILRTDTDANEAKNWVECAIFEFKNTNIIKFKHFKEGRIKNPETKEGQLTRARLEEEASKLPENTMLTSNAIHLSKQARKYARRTPFVGLFDWDTMALYDFTGVNLKGKNPICPRISFFSEHEVNDDKLGENGRTFRMFLLGFVANAVHRKCTEAGIKFETPGNFTFPSSTS